MAKSCDSVDGGGAQVQQCPVETTLDEPSASKLQSFEGSGRFAPPADAANYSGDFENSGEGVYVQGEERTPDAAVQDSAAYEDRISAARQQAFVTCLKECEIQTPAVDCTEIIEPSALGHGNYNSDGNAKGNMKPQESKGKKEKKPRRRGGKVRKNNEVLNCYSNERKEKKGLQYSREEMEALRFENLEEQKKKWIEVYCRLGAAVAEEYDGLARGHKIPLEDSIPSFDFDFDPRPQFQTSDNLGEECSQLADNHLDDLSISGPSSLQSISKETELSVLEEEPCEDDDSDEDYSSIQRPAFLVTGEPDFDSGPPLDGLEYLRRVRWESARIPKVKVAKVNKIKEQSSYMPQIPDVMKCPDDLLPLKEWEDSFLADFSELRQAFTQLDLQKPSAENSTRSDSAHEEHILGQLLESKNSDKFVSLRSADDSCPSEDSSDLETTDAKSDPHSPKNSSCEDDRATLSRILKMDSAARTLMLKRRINSIENMNRISRDESVWLFALCVAVDCPLDADTSATVRCLLRKCASLRATKEVADDEVIILNILATISGRYFGQLPR